MRVAKILCRILVVLLGLVSLSRAKDDDDDPAVKLPSMCEVCKYLVTELQDRLDETGKTKEVLRTGHGVDRQKKELPYHVSELRLIEAMEDPHICHKILEYNMHKEREGSLRFAKGQSQTMETLEGLVAKGVKVDLGIPHELWDKPSAEVTDMQRKCFMLVEDYEEDISDWYFHHQKQDLMTFLCRKKVLNHGDQECLTEVFIPKEVDMDANNEDSKNEDSKNKNTKNKKKKKNLKGETEDKEEL